MRFANNSGGGRDYGQKVHLAVTALSRHGKIMKEWKPKLKHYPHFDAPLSEEEAINIVTDPKKVAENRFYPFLCYIDRTQKYRDSKNQVRVKERPIRYACRRDSYIFSYYRHLLSKRYEELLVNYSISDNISAYRRVPVAKDGGTNKCNIDFAYDVFSEIKRRGNCLAVAMDINSYFEKIDHAKLKKLWCEVMNVDELSPDHEAVFKNVTAYNEIDFDTVCTLLGFKGKVTIKGIDKMGFLLSKDSFFRGKEYKQLCSPKQFREKIVPTKKIIPNKHSYGIPQGSPISDVLANLYLINFDRVMSEYAKNNNLYYRRYSDDILFVMPDDNNLLNDLFNVVESEIMKAGDELKIKAKKTIIKKFTSNDEKIKCQPLKTKHNIEDNQACDFEYLGFAYDGQNVRIKDSTMHNFNRKMKSKSKQLASKTIKRYPDKTPTEIMGKINFSMLYQSFGNINDFGSLDFSIMADKKKLTFVSYAKRSHSKMESLGSIIAKQMSGHKKRLFQMLESEVSQYWCKHHNNS